MFGHVVLINFLFNGIKGSKAKKKKKKKKIGVFTVTRPTLSNPHPDCKPLFFFKFSKSYFQNKTNTGDLKSKVQNKQLAEAIWVIMVWISLMSRAMRKCVLCHMRTTKAQISLRIRGIGSQRLKLSSRGQRRLWSDWFCHVAAHMYVPKGLILPLHWYQTLYREHCPCSVTAHSIRP